MKKLQNRLLFMIIIGISITTIATGFIYFVSFGESERAKSVTITELESERAVTLLNEVLLNAENMTKGLNDYYIATLPSVDDLADPAVYEEYSNTCLEVAKHIAAKQDLIGAIFYRFNPDICGPTAGFFLTKDSEHDEFIEQIPTNITDYDPSDRGRVAWYYEPIENGEALWLTPYFNKNNNLDTITYAMPVYAEDGTVVGVVGMDVDYTKLQSWLDETSLTYKSTVLLLSSEGDVVYSDGDYPTEDAGIFGEIMDKESDIFTYEIYGIQYDGFSYRLNNGNYVVFIVGDDDMTIEERRLELAVVLVTILMLTILIGVFTEVIYRIFDKAQRDKLTGAYNRDAYSAKITDIEQSFSFEGYRSGVSVVVFDVNGLKQINDNYGHYTGDEIIKKAYEDICEYFKNYDVYRIGGDEFVIVSDNLEYVVLASCLEKFKAEMGRRIEAKVVVTQTPIISAGISRMDKENHHCYDDVFASADKNMYKEKKAFYESHPEMSRRGGDRRK